MGLYSLRVSPTSAPRLKPALSDWLPPPLPSCLLFLSGTDYPSIFFEAGAGAYAARL